MDITTATPAQIDTEIARMNGEIARHSDAREAAEATLDRIAKVQGTYEADYPWNSYEKQEEASAVVRLADAKIARLRGEVAPLNAEFVTRGGWTRFFLVTNTGGHVHSTTACSSCFPTTQFAWLTDYSGMTNGALVEEAGSMACTVCFPDAPVETLSRATRIKYESAEAKARRVEREAKAAAKAAAEVVVENYVGWRGKVETKTFKSVRAVTNDIASNLSSLVCYGTEHPDGHVWLANIDSCRKALDARGETYDYDKALTAARKRYIRESAPWGKSEPKF